MIHVALYQPEIPPNTGNVIRLCANTGAHLHLIHPLGFRMEDRELRRAGLDYHEYAEVKEHASLDALRSALPQSRLFAFSTKGSSRHTDIGYQTGDILLFGPETRGLPTDVLQRADVTKIVRIPLRPGNRSLNLSNAVAVAVYEAWRQANFGDPAAAH
jgi:tRNA (cytidine/uridine-2'-O-)-methyltransferase